MNSRQRSLGRATSRGRAAIIAVTMLMLGATSQTKAELHYLAVDIPTQLGVETFTTEQVVKSVDGVYSLELTLPSGAALSALHQKPDGSWLMSFAHPFAQSGTTFEPRDVAAYDGLNLTPFLSGSAIGIPPDARIDALFLDGGGHAVLSFATPTRLGSVDYGPSDLVRYDSAFALYWDAQAAGVPPGSNLCGAATTPAGALVVTFDVPTRLGSTDYLPGQLVSWTGSGFVTFASDPPWPPGSQLRDFSFFPAAGAVQESSDLSRMLVVDKTGGPGLALTWGASCRASDTDYEVYEGSIATDFASHTPVLCSTDGSASVTLVAEDGDRYFLVVPRNAVAEGSYGSRSDGSERPQSPSACLPRVSAACR